MEKTLYPKTERIINTKIIITEKLDGSNLGIFKLNGKLLIAQRNHCFYEDELDSNMLYKGLFGWINENKNTLDINEGSGVFGEWIGMGQIKYNLDKKFYIFAKANINEDLEIRNLIYKPELFIYPFISGKIPECIGVVPVVTEFENISFYNLDVLFEDYKKRVGRQVEGFIINNSNQITKYVRCKNGRETEHFIYNQ